MSIRASDIFQSHQPKAFEALALQLFRYQFQKNEVYHNYCTLLGIGLNDVNHIEAIPYLPIGFFKTKTVVSGFSANDVETVFTSSGTTAMAKSKHFVPELSLYKNSYLACFEQFYGPIEDYCVLALLPSYLERDGSSLIYMANDFIKRSKYAQSGFYLSNLKELKAKLLYLEETGVKTLLLGVSFALLNLLESHQFELNNTIVMETGGMKGRRKEMIRSELHDILKRGFGVDRIHSEYGMTELLSQGYSKGQGIFQCPPWMRVSTRDTEDPLSSQGYGKTGGINIVDLANLNSCAFIATQDLGKVYENGSFEVLGRFDHSDVRGCNLMVL